MTAQKNPAPTTSPVHDLIRHRWSPRAFDPRPIEPEKLRSLFEAARWAASSFNAQPWFFIVGTKDDPKTYQLILDTFIEFNQGWAKGAPVLALSVARLNFPNDVKPNRHAFHDVGQAAANLAIEATAQGLTIHQMAGIDPEKARKNFGIPEGYEAVAGIAIGYPGDPEALSDSLRARETAPRERKPLESFVFSEKWGEPSRIVAAQK